MSHDRRANSYAFRPGDKGSKCADGGGRKIKRVPGIQFGGLQHTTSKVDAK
jgi:hypothetical protein